jgi:hypothetical protein
MWRWESNRQYTYEIWLSWKFSTAILVLTVSCIITPSVSLPVRVGNVQPLEVNRIRFRQR